MEEYMRKVWEAFEAYAGSRAGSKESAELFGKLEDAILSGTVRPS